MLYKSAQDYLDAPNKSVALFGMSGLGKTFLGNLLRQTGSWFQYSVDYRIGSHYMALSIADNLKLRAMNDPLLRQLLRSGSIKIKSEITFDDLSPLSTYLGKPGDPVKGGIPFDEYRFRQNEHRVAELRAMEDIRYFRIRARNVYGYGNFVADCSGSLSEILDNNIANDALMAQVAAEALPVWIKGPASHNEVLVERFQRAPKPMYYQPDFLDRKWSEYLSERKIAPDAVDPDDFILWGYRQLLEDRLPRYAAVAEHWGVTIRAGDAAGVKSEDDFNVLIANAIAEKT